MIVLEVIASASFSLIKKFTQNSWNCAYLVVLGYVYYELIPSALNLGFNTQLTVRPGLVVAQNVAQISIPKIAELAYVKIIPDK